MVKEPDLLAASVANMIMGMVFGGAIVNFFPLYAASLAINEATIGYIFSIRSFISTLTRMPTGLLTIRFSSKYLMIIALAIAMLALFAISITISPGILAVCVAVEGAAFGLFLTSGQTFVAKQSTEVNRGKAIGIYGMAGSTGATVGPFHGCDRGTLGFGCCLLRHGHFGIRGNSGAGIYELEAA